VEKLGDRKKQGGNFPFINWKHQNCTRIPGVFCFKRSNFERKRRL